MLKVRDSTKYTLLMQNKDVKRPYWESVYFKPWLELECLQLGLLKLINCCFDICRLGGNFSSLRLNWVHINLYFYEKSFPPLSKIILPPLGFFFS